MSKKLIRQLIKFSNYSLCTTLPKDIIDILGWKPGDSISFSLDKRKQDIILSKIHSDKPLRRAAIPVSTLPRKSIPILNSTSPATSQSSPLPSSSFDDLKPIPPL